MRLQEQICRKWAFFQAGDLKRARSVSLRLVMLSSDYFKTRHGFRLLRYAAIACAALATILCARSFHMEYIETPTLTAARLRHFYAGEFLDRYRQGFPEEPSEDPYHVPESHMALYYSQPPSMISIPGVAEAYIALQKRELDTFAERTIRYHAAQLLNGLEAGYLTVPMLQSWGLTRQALSPNHGKRPEWATLEPKILSGQTKLGQSELDHIAARVRLLNALGLLDLMDPAVPDEIVKRLVYRHGAFWTKEHPSDKAQEPWGALGPTCLTACILNLFNRWDLAEREAIRRWIVSCPRRRWYYFYSKDVYLLGLGVVAVGAEDELPLTKLAAFNRPTIGPVSRESSWGIAPYDIGAFAVNDILSTGRLLGPRLSADSQDRRSKGT